MKLRLDRTWCGPVCTIGTLSVNGAYECFTLEDLVRVDPNLETPANEAKVYAQTAIPAGAYSVTITKSKRFGREMPLVENVPGFEGVRIHPGNTAADTEGCILVGRFKMHDQVGESRKAFEALFAKIKAAIAAGEEVTLEVT